MTAQNSAKERWIKRLKGAVESSGWVWVGALFLLVNLGYSYDFYHVNSFKMGQLGLGLALLFLLSLFRLREALPSWPLLVLVLVPLACRLPGAFWHGAGYNLPYDLAGQLLLFLWFALLLTLLKDVSGLRQFSRFLSATLLYVSLWAFLEASGLHPLVSGEAPEYPISTFGHRNYMSGFLVLLLPLSLAWALRSRSWERGLHGSAFALGLVALMLAQTRAAILGLLISLVLFVLFTLLWRFPRHKTRILLGALLVFLLGALGLYFAWSYAGDWSGQSRFAQLFEQDSWTGRWIPWQAAWNGFLESPWLGHGLGSSYDLFFAHHTPLLKLIHFESSYNHAHSEPLEFLAEGGLLGLLALVIFWAFLGRALWRGLKGEHFLLSLGVATGLLAFGLHSLVSVAPRMMVVGLPLYALLAMAFLLGGWENEKGSWPKVGTLGVVLLLSLWLLLPWLGRQYRFVADRDRLAGEDRALAQRTLEAMTDRIEEERDIYALYHLARMQLQAGDAMSVERAARRIAEIIPHYRQVDYFQGASLAMRGRRTEALDVLQRAQERSRYDMDVIRLTAILAMAEGEKELFFRQVELFTRHLAFKKGLVSGWREEALEYILIKEGIRLVQGDESVRFGISQDLLELLWSEGQASQAHLESQPKELGMLLEGELGKNAYFLWRKKVDQGEALILEKVRRYMALVRKGEGLGVAESEEFEQLEKLLTDWIDLKAFMGRQDFAREWARGILRLLYA